MVSLFSFLSSQYVIRISMTMKVKASCPPCRTLGARRNLSLAATSPSFSQFTLSLSLKSLNPGLSHASYHVHLLSLILHLHLLHSSVPIQLP
mmetsp:Transcript_11372/g.25904  ORF Transcript_11372/g.25904 Transcript_11372/m.25904 type:complete len:92 (-) Transcript_11372:20-295(-)